jgi:hypothetical protein
MRQIGVEHKTRAGSGPTTNLSDTSFIVRAVPYALFNLIGFCLAQII